MKHLMKRTLALLCVLAMLLSVLPAALAAEDTAAEFVVLSTTDMHGRCWDKNVLNDTNANNTMLNVATAVAGIRADYDNVILLDNGDTYQGTPVSTYQLSLQQLGETELPNPMALSMKEIGYTAATVGNHEFNYAWNLMDEVRDYLADGTQGNVVESLCANLYYDGSDGVHERGENVFTPYMFKEFALGEKTYKIAIIGFVTPDCTRWDIPDNYPGMVFYHPDNATCSMALEAQKYVAEVKEQGADAVIVAYHSGLGDGAAPEDIEFGVNSEGQVLSMIKYNTGIDLVVAGHDHSSGYSGKTYKDAENKDVMVVNGAGNALTKTVFAVNESGELYIKSNTSLGLSNYTADAELKAKIQPYVELASSYVNQECGTILEGDWSKSTNFYLQQTDTMDVVGRAQIYAGSKYMAEKYATEEAVAALYEATGLDHLTVDMSSTSVVVSGNYTVQPGTMTMKKIYQLYKYDNTLYLLPLTGQEIKDIMEFNASQRLAVNTASGTPSFSCIGDSFTNPVFYGLDFQYDMSEEVGNRVEIKGFTNGNEFDLEKTYIFAVNNYHLGNGPFADYSTDDTIWSQTDDLGGGVVQDLIADWLKAETEAKGGVSPAPSDWKLVYDKDVVIGDATGDYILDLVSDPATLKDGDTVALLNVANNVLVTNTASGTKLAPSTDVSNGNEQIGTNTAATLFTVEIGEDGYYRFLDAAGKYMTSAPTGNGLSMADGDSELAGWEPVAAEGGFYLRNIGAAYNGNYNQHLEFYSGAFTTYGLQSGGAAYLINIYRLGDGGATECTHETTEVRDAKAATCTEAGYTGDTYCTACGEKIAEGEAIAALGHTFVDGVCTVCGDTDPDYVPPVELPTYDDFSDLPADAWYKGDVEYALANGLMNGMGDGKFEPEGSLTRAMLVTILYRAEGSPSVEGLENPFTDLVEEWYKAPIIWAASKGIVKGITETEYAPDEAITREQVATILYRYVGEPDVADAEAPFVDMALVSDYAVDAVIWSYGAGIFEGDEAGVLDPQGNATRCQIAAILHRFLES